MGGGHSNMKVTPMYKYLYRRTKVGGIRCKISLEKKGHSVWAPKNGIFFDVDSQKGGSFSVQKMQFQAKICKFYTKFGRKICKFLSKSSICTPSILLPVT